MWTLDSYDIEHDLPLEFRTIFPKGYNDIQKEEEFDPEGGFALKKLLHILG